MAHLLQLYQLLFRAARHAHFPHLLFPPLLLPPHSQSQLAEHCGSQHVDQDDQHAPQVEEELVKQVEPEQVIIVDRIIDPADSRKDPNRQNYCRVQQYSPRKALLPLAHLSHLHSHQDHHHHLHHKTQPQWSVVADHLAEQFSQIVAAEPADVNGGAEQVKEDGGESEGEREAEAQEDNKGLQLDEPLIAVFNADRNVAVQHNQESPVDRGQVSKDFYERLRQARLRPHFSCEVGRRHQEHADGGKHGGEEQVEELMRRGQCGVSTGGPREFGRGRAGVQPAVPAERVLPLQLSVLQSIHRSGHLLPSNQLSFMIQDLPPDFEIISEIGAGSYGKVFKALHRPSSRILALKLLPVQERLSFNRQSLILKKCDCPHILTVLDNIQIGKSLWLVLQYCAGGSLVDIIKAREETFSQRQIAAVMEQTAKALLYLHNNNKIHRDIKASNLLLDHSGKIKLADFGVSAEIIQSLKDSKAGSPYWMSPQIISGQKYNQKTDIWSLGITAIELAQGQPPYSHIHPNRAMFIIKSGGGKGLTNKEQWSIEFNQFVSMCLIREVQSRPSARQLLEHKFLKDVNSKNILQKLYFDSIQLIEKQRNSPYFQDVIYLNVNSMKDRFQSIPEEPSPTGTVVQISDRYQQQQKNQQEQPQFMRFFKKTQSPPLKKIEEQMKKLIDDYGLKLDTLQQQTLKKLQTWLQIIQLSYGPHERSRLSSYLQQFKLRKEGEFTTPVKPSRFIKLQKTQGKQADVDKFQQFLKDSQLMQFIKKLK